MILLRNENTLIAKPEIRLKTQGENLGRMFYMIDFTDQKYSHDEKLLDEYTKQVDYFSEFYKTELSKMTSNLLFTGKNDPLLNQKSIMDLSKVYIMNGFRKIEVETTACTSDLSYEFVQWIKEHNVKICLVLRELGKEAMDNIGKLVNIFDKEEIEYYMIFEDNTESSRRNSFKQTISNILFCTQFSDVNIKFPVYAKSASGYEEDMASTLDFCFENNLIFVPKIEPKIYRGKKLESK